MRRFICLWLAVLAVSYCYGQNVTVSARVVDKESKEPLPFASVGIKGKPIGTVANLLGEFDFHFPSEYSNEILIISMLGYKNFEAPASEMLQLTDREIQLEKSTTVLNPVVVSDTLSGGDIMRIALMRIDQNHPSSPFLLDAFYRDVKKIGGTYVSLLESAVKIYDEDYREPRNKFKLRERVQLLEVRRSLGYGNRFTSYFDSDNLLEEVLLFNSIRYRQFPAEELFFNSIQRAKNSTYNEREVFVVYHLLDYKLKVFVDAQTFGILRLEYEDALIRPINKKRGMMSKFVALKKVIDFKFYEGKLYLNYLNVLSKINWYDIETDELKFETELDQVLMVNKVFPNTDEYISGRSKMRNYGLQYQDMPYNKTFWDEYNVIKQSPLDRKIIADLELVGPLDKQFEKN